MDDGEDDVIVESISLQIDEGRIQEQIKVNTEDRKHFIGGSDQPVILGLSNFKSRYDLYLEKIGETIPDDLSDVERVQAGIVMEDVIATLYMRRTGQRLRRVNQRLTSSEHGIPWAVQIDRMVVGEKVPLEIKNQDTFMRDQWGEEGSSDVSITYYPQVQQQIDMAGTAYGKVAAFFGGNKLITFKVPHDPAFIADMVEADRYFWECVTNKTAPDPVDIEEATMMWARAPAEKVYGTSAEAQLIGFIADAKEKIKQLNTWINAAKIIPCKLMQMKGDTLIVDGKSVCSWKTQETAFFDLEEFRKVNPELAKFYTKSRASRVFRLNKAGIETAFDPVIIKQLIEPYLAKAEELEEKKEEEE